MHFTCYFYKIFRLYTSRFLDQSDKTHLIRWSDDGESVTILDEDEFARSMIPELFKHNNYASFVRQLNMYGFHKKVGLADNSMKSNERKAKAPSEYHNPYFKRGKPDLLWLIKKPKPVPVGSQSSGKRKREDERSLPAPGNDEDEPRLSPEVQDLPPERIRAEDQQSSATLRQQGRQGGQGLATLPHTELAKLRDEVTNLQRTQQFILNIISKMRSQNEQVYEQAAAFQSLHDRHENSINAILTFLASFYNRSLDGHNGQNRANMFANTIPQHAQQSSNFSEVTEVQEVSQPQNVRNARRPLALLPAPESGNAAMFDSLSREASSTPTVATLAAAATTTAAAAATSTPSNSVADQVSAGKVPYVYRTERAAPNDEAAASLDGQGKIPVTPPIKFEATSPTVNSGSGSGFGSGSGSFSSSQKNDDMMAAIHSANAAQNGNPSNTVPMTESSMDFSSTLNRLQSANGKAPLTSQGQNDNLSTIAANQGSLGMTQPASVPDLNQLVAHRAHLDMLHKMQEEQAQKVNSLAYRLRPLSPTGSIPGLNHGLGDGSVGMATPELNDASGYFGNVRGAGAGAGADADAGFENDLDIGVGDAGNTGLTPANDFNLEAFIETGDYITNAQLEANAGDDSDANGQSAAAAGQGSILSDPANAVDDSTAIDTDEANTFFLSQNQQQQQMMVADSTTVGRIDSLSSQSQNDSQSDSPAGSGTEIEGTAASIRGEIGTTAAAAASGAQKPKRRRFR